MAVTSVFGNFEITGLSSTVVVRNAEITINRGVFETTNLSEFSRTYTEGLRGATASATLLYENSLLDDVYAKINADDQDAISATLTLNTGKTISGDVLITDVGSTVTVGDITSTNVSFQFSGNLSISSS